MSEQQDPAPHEPVAAFTPPSPEELAAMLPHYTVDYLIASGGMGAVYRGLQIDLDRPVAIKVLPPEAGEDAESLNRFRSEARAMAKLNHPNIVSIYDFGAVQGQCYFIMEFVEGRNLFDLISNREVAPGLALHVMCQVCDALTYAHAKSIVHGDIKPSNIVLDAEGMVKLLDFGLARLMEHGHHHELDDETWTPMGTPEYAAPELYDRNVASDHRADLYALGVILYEMLMGRVPQGTFELPTTTLQVDPRVDEIIVRCLRAEPENRYQNAAEIRQVLEDIRTGKPIAPVPDAMRQGTVRQVFRPRPAVRRPNVAGPGPISSSSMASGKAAVDRIRAIEEDQKRKSRNTMVAIGAVLVILAIVIAVILSNSGGNSENSGGGKTGDAGPKTGQEKAAPPPPKGAEPIKEMPKTIGQAGPTKITAEPPKPPVPDPGKAKPSDPPTDPYPALTLRLTEFVKRYKTEVQGKLEAQLADLGKFYKQYLERLEEEFLNRADASSVLEIRKEGARYEATRKEPSNSDISRIPKLAELQKKLKLKFEDTRNALAPNAEKLNQEFSEALGKLHGQLSGRPQEAAAVKAMKDEMVGVPDYLGVLAGYRDPPPAMTGAIEDGDVALAAKGATADAPNNPGGLIDGVPERDGAASGSPGSYAAVQFGKIYRIDRVVVHLSNHEDHHFNYVLEGSIDGMRWTVLEDRSSGEWRGEQEIKFKAQPLKHVRIKIVGSTGIQEFIIKEIQAFCEGK